MPADLQTSYNSLRRLTLLSLLAAAAECGLSDRALAHGLKLVSPPVQQASLRAMQADGLVVCRQVPSERKPGLTEQVWYIAPDVDLNFNI